MPYSEAGVSQPRAWSGKRRPAAGSKQGAGAALSRDHRVTAAGARARWEGSSEQVCKPRKDRASRLPAGRGAPARRRPRCAAAAAQRAGCPARPPLYSRPAALPGASQRVERAAEELPRRAGRARERAARAAAGRARGRGAAAAVALRRPKHEPRDGGDLVQTPAGGKLRSEFEFESGGHGGRRRVAERRCKAARRQAPLARSPERGPRRRRPRNTHPTLPTHAAPATQRTERCPELCADPASSLARGSPTP